MTEKNGITISCGNVFADLGLPEPETLLAKAELARRINAIVQERDLNQEEAASLLGIDQAQLTALSRGNLAGFSTERLFHFLNALDRDVQITIRAKPASRKHAHVTITPTSRHL